MIFRRFGILLFLVLLFHTEGFMQSINDIKKEKAKSEKEISYLNKLLEDAVNNKSLSAEKLNILRQKIVQSKNVINSLSQEVKYIQDQILDVEKRIDELQNNKNSLLDLYSKLVYVTWKKKDRNDKLMFIFSSADFNQAYNRFKYFQQLQEYSGRQLQLIRKVNDSLDLKILEMKSLVSQKNETLNVINVKNKDLESEQVKENQYISELRKKEKEMRKKLEAEMNNRRKLANELDKLIARQIKKSGSTTSSYKLTPEEKLVSDDFVKNRGRLPWPVAEGFISERFGVHVHAVWKRVDVPSNGVVITTSKNANVRAVFQGVVVEIYFHPYFNNIVVIRHGSYLTMYSNLEKLTVKKGDQVKTKDVIGRIAFDVDKGNTMEFQVWKNIEKLNPELWLAK